LPECRSAFFDLPKDAVDLGDLVQQLLPTATSVVLLGLAELSWWLSRTSVKSGVLRQIDSGLEVSPSRAPRGVLDEVGALLFDQDGPGLEDLSWTAFELSMMV